jgi:TonB family protein
MDRTLRRPSPSGKRRGALACLAILLSPPALADAPASVAPPPRADTRDRVSMQGAFAKLRDKHPAGYVADLQVLAAYGDDRAQYLLGIAYLEGRGTERDVVQGYAWLQIAARSNDGRFTLGGATAAKEALLRVSPQVSGADMLRADRIMAQLLNSVQRDLDAAMDRVERAMLDSVQGRAAPPTNERQDDGPYPGCALDPSMRDCPKPRSELPPAQRCQGTWQGNGFNATNATNATISDAVVQKSYPPEARRRGFEGHTVVAVHVDRSGTVCQVMLVRTSGFTLLDNASIWVAQRLLYEPVISDGKPVESFRRFAFLHKMIDHWEHPDDKR